jgi:hypothetical protein
VREGAAAGAPGLFDRLPEPARRWVYSLARQQVMHVVSGLLTDCQEELASHIDLTAMGLRYFCQQKHLVVAMFVTVAFEGLSVIINTGAPPRFELRALAKLSCATAQPPVLESRLPGAVMGCLFGLLQLVVFIAFDADWVLPAFGLLVGALTNWLALKIVFHPLKPLWIGPFKLHGVYLREPLRTNTCEVRPPRSIVSLLPTRPRRA